MADKVAQRSEGDGKYSIQILPEKMGPSSGFVLDADKHVLGPWGYPGVGDIWFDVGTTKRGFLREEGIDGEQSWTITHVFVG